MRRVEGKPGWYRLNRDMVSVNEKRAGYDAYLSHGACPTKGTCSVPRLDPDLLAFYSVIEVNSRNLRL